MLLKLYGSQISLSRVGQREARLGRILELQYLASCYVLGCSIWYTLFIFGALAYGIVT